MSAPYFGIDFIKMDDEPRPVLGADLSTIGLIGPIPEADTDVFPFDTPVKMESSDTAMAVYLGRAGYIPDALRAINDQLAETQFAARCVIINTQMGDHQDPAIALQQTISHIVGDSLDGTGINAFLKSPHTLGFTPRIIMAPGYTGQMANGVGVVTRVGGGTGYADGARYEIVFEGGGEFAVQATGHALGQEDGKLGFVTLDTPGAWYTEAPDVIAEAPPPKVAQTSTYTATVLGGIVNSVTQHIPGQGYVTGDTYAITPTGGSPSTPAVIHAVGQANGTLGLPVIDDPGAGYTGTPTLAADAAPTPTQGTRATYTATFVTGANPVCASLPAILNQLFGHAIVESSGINQELDGNWRETLQSERLIALSGGVRVMDPVSTDIIFRPLAPRMAGIMVKRDHETGAPFHSSANQPVYGIVGPGRDIAFSITDGANEAQELLTFNIGCLVRGEVGNDFAIASGGFVLISVDNLSEDTLWKFYNVTRGRDFIHLSLLRAMRYFLGRFNITGHTIQAILNTMEFFLRDLQADDHILGHRINFTSAGNSAEQIRLGHLTVGFKAEEPPVLCRITTESYRYRPAIDAMVSALEAQLNIAA
jgi:Bacteriophage tail sheath protein